RDSAGAGARAISAFGKDFADAHGRTVYDGACSSSRDRAQDRGGPAGGPDHILHGPRLDLSGRRLTEQIAKFPFRWKEVQGHTDGDHRRRANRASSSVRQDRLALLQHSQNTQTSAASCKVLECVATQDVAEREDLSVCG